MTVSENIIEWLKTFNPSDYWNMPEIDTDLQAGRVASYSLLKEPIVNVKHYLSGKEEHDEFYQLSARLESQENLDRVDNGAWLEALEKWVREQNKAKNFPNIAGITRVEISSSFSMGRVDANTSLYSLTIKVKYTI